MQKININEIPWEESEHDEFTFSRKKVGVSAKSKMLGASIYKLSPGKKSFPLHAHYANEEAVLILQGSGVLRLINQEVEISKNDYISLPTGLENAHQIINTSKEDLMYLCISTMIEPDVIEYPDSEKIGVLSGSAPGAVKHDNSKKFFFKQNSAVSYFTDEK